MLGETDRYEELRDFLQNRMQMSHIYQPVMLMTLLGSGGRCHEKEIASALLSQDPTQVEYYTKVTTIWLVACCIDTVSSPGIGQQRSIVSLDTKRLPRSSGTLWQASARRDFGTSSQTWRAGLRSQTQVRRIYQRDTKVRSFEAGAIPV